MCSYHIFTFHTRVFTEKLAFDMPLIEKGREKKPEETSKEFYSTGFNYMFRRNL